MPDDDNGRRYVAGIVEVEVEAEAEILVESERIEGG